MPYPHPAYFTPHPYYRLPTVPPPPPSGAVGSVPGTPSAAGVPVQAPAPLMPHGSSASQPTSSGDGHIPSSPTRTGTPSLSRNSSNDSSPSGSSSDGGAAGSHGVGIGAGVGVSVGVGAGDGDGGIGSEGGLMIDPSLGVDVDDTMKMSDEEAAAAAAVHAVLRSSASSHSHDSASLSLSPGGKHVDDANDAGSSSMFQSSLSPCSESKPGSLPPASSSMHSVHGHGHGHGHVPQYEYEEPDAHLEPKPLVRPEPMEQMLTEDGEPMLNPAELLTSESLASPPPS
ncbi:hypothetical protein CONPUDRAFT_134525 [Coniophora puteana RWD-64-598 SS2]|uniref:Uncharacterized protein n=1 Tax=Coniophora puteana (strain RWD-64-598) TaxID=741705 RepID=A0A5M3N823_CONPW|nr:uncharacterized protein CONPUDRAFT_134525 [Coniophora puteana RWD-64-598 SS2]EIW87307.1 hypothetical protein CONPUDRAFT_134525 [Coniophora puteana RWD-64-598 SS2]